MPQFSKKIDKKLPWWDGSLPSVILGLFVLSHSAKLIFFRIVLLFSYLGQKGTPLFIGSYVVVVTFFFLYLLSLNKKRFLIFFYSLEVLYLIINYNYFVNFQSYLMPGHILSLFQEGAVTYAEGAVSMGWKNLIFLIDLPFLVWFLRNQKSSLAVVIQPSLRKLSFAIFMVITFLTWGGLGLTGKFPWNVTKKSSLGPATFVRNYGLLTLQFLSFIQENEKVFSDELQNHLDGASTYSFSPRKGDPPNFIMIQVESLDANVLSAVYQNSLVMPYLSALSHSSIFYPYTIAYHFGGRSSDADFAVLNSIEPLQNYAAFKLMNYEYPNSLVKRLRQNGYTAVAFHNNTRAFFNRDMAYAKMGFQSFYDRQTMHLKEQGWGAPDHEMFKFILDELPRLKRPFFSYIITMSSHEPHNYYRTYFDDPRYDDIQDDNIRNLFKSFSYVDQSLAHFIPELQKIPNTTIFIYGDHSAFIVDKKITDPLSYKTFGKCSFQDSKKLFECVPLIVITPDGQRYEEVNQVASMLDLAPTVLQISGVHETIKSNGIPLWFINKEVQPLSYGELSFKRSRLLVESELTLQ